MNDMTGHYDYSKIVRNAGAFVPHRKLLIIYNRYDVPSGDTGDIFTVNRSRRWIEETDFDAAKIYFQQSKALYDSGNNLASMCLVAEENIKNPPTCLLYTSDAADE
mgnify:CR=1 FL=1